MTVQQYPTQITLGFQQPTARKLSEMSAELANMRAQDSSMDAGDVDVTEEIVFSGTIKELNDKMEAFYRRRARECQDILERLLGETGSATDATHKDLTTADRQGDTVVHWAARRGCCRRLRPLLTESVVSVRNQSDVTPLHVAADRGLHDEVQVLLEAGATLTTDGDGWTPLHAAAASGTADCSVVRLLVDAVVRIGDSLLDAKTKSSYTSVIKREDSSLPDTVATSNAKTKPVAKQKFGGDTALHLAARNDKAPSPDKLIGELGRLNPKVENGYKDTPFHVAARCQNQAVMDAMFKTFQTCRFGDHWQDSKLLNICASRGNAEAVGELIRRGIDFEFSSKVLRVIVGKSVSSPSESERILGVYYTIVDHAVLWRYAGTGEKMPRPETEKYGKLKRRTVIHMLTKPLDANEKDKDRQKQKPSEEQKKEKKQNVMEYIIQKGAVEFLRAVLNTPGVSRFFYYTQKRVPTVTYDVTDMMWFTRSTDDKGRTEQEVDASTTDASSKRWFSPKRCYLEYMLNDCSDQWRQSGIINEEPFRILTKPLLTFGKIFCFVVTLLQLAFMITFSSLYTPDWTHCTSGQCDANASSSSGIEAEEYPSWLWLVWPSVILFGYVYLICVRIYPKLLSIPHKLELLLQFLLKPCSEKLRQILDAKLNLTHQLTALFHYIYIIPTCGFSVALCIWYHAHRYWEGHDYYQVTSIVFLFGWITTFIFFCSISKNFYIFYVIIVEIIVIDIINGFIPVFVFTLLAFSSALYVLRGQVDNNTLHDSHDLNFYKVFASGLGMSDYIEYTIDEHGRGRFFRLMFAVYVIFMALVLVNLLIAMMTHSYERARDHAKSICRFDGVIFGHRVGRVAAKTSRAVRWLTRGRLCGGRAFISFIFRCYPDNTETGRYMIDVEERTSTMTLTSEQVRLRKQVHAAVVAATRRLPQ